MRFAASKKRYQEACKVLALGVSSGFRRGVRPTHDRDGRATRSSLCPFNLVPTTRLVLFASIVETFRIGDRMARRIS